MRLKGTDLKNCWDGPTSSHVFYLLGICRKTRETPCDGKRLIRDVVPGIENESAGNVAEINEKSFLNTFNLCPQWRKEVYDILKQQRGSSNYAQNWNNNLTASKDEFGMGLVQDTYPVYFRVMTHSETFSPSTLNLKTMPKEGAWESISLGIFSSHKTFIKKFYYVNIIQSCS